ncbi:MAG TPA: helix-turn-helix domain-containing protein [Bacteroidia bacterium]|nr:helix-turn-helix domain-containing protein [Bacteroidia bacterium]
MTVSKENATEKIILEAALKVFTEKGFAAARTEEIAREAGINRALLHYYFRDKETIFDLIFGTQFKAFFSGIQTIMRSDASLFEKIEKMVAHEIGTFQEHPHLARFIIVEIARQPERLLAFSKQLQINPREILTLFEKQVRTEIEKGVIIEIEGKQLLMNIMSLCIYPFVARPIIKTMMQFDEKEMQLIMEQRKQEVVRFIVKAIKK